MIYVTRSLYIELQESNSVFMPGVTAAVRLVGVIYLLMILLSGKCGYMAVYKASTHLDLAQTPVAIIGMAGLFPGSPGLKAYWQLLLHGRDAVTDIPDTHWSVEAYFNADPKTPDHVYCKRGAFLPPVAFDPSEFGIPPASLEAPTHPSCWR
jgi:hypothetical protein